MGIGEKENGGEALKAPNGRSLKIQKKSRSGILS
jgi:hypothetical protein